MKSKTPRLKTLCLFLAIPASFFTGVLTADEIDDLLAPKKDEVKLVDDSATEAWNSVVDAFQRNDLAKAKELGTAFLAASHKTSPYQVLGVRVMMDLANADNPTVTHDVGLNGEMKRLMAERDVLRAKFANLQRIAQAADARINKLTNNRTQGVQAGTQVYRECARAAQEMDQANAAMEAMKPEIAANKEKVGKVEVGANENLKSDTLKLLDMLTEAGEIEAAFAVANVFARVAGSDLDVAKKQQDVIRLRELESKATSIVKVIQGKQKSLIEQERFWEAATVGEQSLSKVSQAGDKDLTRLVTGKMSIDPLSIKRTIAKAESESKALRELARVDALKAKAMLRDFRSKYADFPEMETLAIAVEGERSGEMKGKVADLIRSVEDLADTDPQQAQAALSQISENDIDPIDRRALETRITTSARKLFLVAEAARSAETKEKIAELLSSVEDLADTDPQRAREILNGLELDDIDPVKRMALETRITTSARKLFLAAEAARSADTKEKIAELLSSVEDLADTDPQRAREILNGLELDDIDPVKRMALETRITTSARKLFLAAEAARSADTKEKIAELLSSVEDLADTDPQRAREILNGLELDDIDPVKRMALETRITTSARKGLDTSLSEMESILSEVKSKLGGEVLQILADANVRTDSTLSLGEQTKAAADIRIKLDQSAELPEVRASLKRLESAISVVSSMKSSEAQKIQLQGIKAEVDVLRMAVK